MVSLLARVSLRKNSSPRGCRSQAERALVLLLNPLTQAERRVKAKNTPEGARDGSRASGPGPGNGPCADRLTRARSEGTREVCGRRVRGAFSFGSFLWASKERNSSHRGETPLINNRRRQATPYPTHTRALRNIRNHGPSSPQSSGCQELATVRNTRSGCGIRMLKRPSGVVSPVIPCGDPLGLYG